MVLSFPSKHLDFLLGSIELRHPFVHAQKDSSSSFFVSYVIIEGLIVGLEEFDDRVLAVWLKKRDACI